MSLQSSFSIRRLGAASLTAGLVLTSAGLAQAQSVARGSDVVIPTDNGTTSSGTTSSTTAPSTLPTSGGNVPLSAVRFLCQNDNGRPTVMYQPESQPTRYYAWAVPQQMGGGWTPERRCTEIASRLERYRPQGLVEMQTGRENGYNTVCVTTDQNASCQIVFTVPQGQDPVSTRDRVFQNLAIADSGQRTSGVFTLQDQQNTNLLGSLGQVLNVDLNGILGQTGLGQTGLGQTSQAAPRSNGINLKPFLDRADGGTGEGLSKLAVTTVQPTAKPAATPVKKPAGKKLRRVFR
jgi:hypothetical protein